MPTTYDAIATQTLASSASSIIFSSIPSTYTDLRLTFSGARTGTGAYWVRFNNDSSVLYSQTVLYGDGASVSAGGQNNADLLEFSFFTTFNTIPIFTSIDLFSYSGSTNKTVLMDLAKDNNGSGYVGKYACLYRSTSAINRIDLIAPTNNFAIGCTATLYGIKNA